MRTGTYHLLVALLAVCFAWLVGTRQAQAHDPNLARWDIVLGKRNVAVTLRTAGAGVFTELRKRDPDADWEAMPADAYRGRVREWLEETYDFREDGLRLDVQVTDIQLGHQTEVAVRVTRLREGSMTAFALDLTKMFSRPNQHHLVFVHHGAQRERFMLHRDNEGGLVLRYRAPDSDAEAPKNERSSHAHS